MGWDGWIDGMVIIGQWSSKSTFGAIKVITLFWQVFCWGLSFILLGHLKIHWDHLTTSSIFFFDSDKDKDIGTDLVYYWHSWHFLTNWETLITTLRFSDWQSESDLESICTSCDVLQTITVCYKSGGSHVSLEADACCGPHDHRRHHHQPRQWRHRWSSLALGALPSSCVTPCKDAEWRDKPLLPDALTACDRGWQEGDLGDGGRDNVTSQSRRWARVLARQSAGCCHPDL